VTGSIAQNGAKPGVLDGWILRDVHRGTAYIEGRMGVIEVDQGDMIPGIGRVDAIKKQDGRWVVVTSKGLIVSR
jgi:hypothetical protein